MKVKFINKVNSLIGLLISVLGFGTISCGKKYGVEPVVAEYGVPYATIEATGTVTDEEKKPIENIRVTVSAQGVYSEAYSDKEGAYQTTDNGAFPVEYVDVIATDTAGIYQADTVRVKMEYDDSNVNSNDHWNEGVGSVKQDFQLKKK